MRYSRYGKVRYCGINITLKEIRKTRQIENNLPNMEPKKATINRSKTLEENLAEIHKQSSSYLSKFKSSLSIILIIKRIDRHANLPIQPIPTTLLRHRNKRPIGPALQRDRHARALFTDGLDVVELDVPLALEPLRLDEHNAVVGQHDEHVLARQFQVRDVVLGKVFAVVEGLKPELAEGFALRVRTDDAVHADEAGETDSV